MSTSWRKPTSLLLLALYALVASFGHALHVHGCKLHEQADWVSDGCQHDHCGKGRLQSSDQASSEPYQNFQQPAMAGGDHACIACVLISQLGVGYSTFPRHLLTKLTSTHLVSVTWDSPRFEVRGTSSSERGPPL